MDDVNRVIFNFLALRRTVAIPSLGTLGVKRNEASLSGDVLFFPENIIVYSASEEGEGIIYLTDHIASLSGLERGDVERALRRWADGVKAAEGRIEGVCWIDFASGRATPDEALDEMLNPSKERSARLTKIKKQLSRIDRKPSGVGKKQPRGGKKDFRAKKERPHGKRWIGWAAAAVAVCVAAGGYMWLKDNHEPVRQQHETTITPVAPEVVEPKLNVEPEPQPKPEPLPNVDTVPESVVPTQPHVSSSAPGPYHLIAGVFSTQENARRYMDQNSAHSSAWEIIPTLTGKYMVSAGSFSDREEAAHEAARLRESFPEIWMHKANGNN